MCRPRSASLLRPTEFESHLPRVGPPPNHQLVEADAVLSHKIPVLAPRADDLSVRPGKVALRPIAVLQDHKLLKARQTQ
eukprot:CAMPEP_0197940924 /NCGR_PEP_ID=MMETSP1439-20131203/122017_1 /TAXON_ID=66791 /ORGANISM="Gonyaulax spinifera, Strain CCMP409" /LENGTH=78 /DNA_ID=CAMNT_0043564105 /DNA_START=63 /DNA_END=296 /DNA_ORIENTATION=+